MASQIPALQTRTKIKAALDKAGEAGLTRSELAHQVGVSDTYASHVVSQLVVEGEVERSPIRFRRPRQVLAAQRQRNEQILTLARGLDLVEDLEHLCLETHATIDECDEICSPQR